eukprot:12694990-Ditylum_brightwellii.AAC.1
MATMGLFAHLLQAKNLQIVHGIQSPTACAWLVDRHIVPVYRNTHLTDFSTGTKHVPTSLARVKGHLRQ